MYNIKSGYFTPVWGVEYCDERLCLSVCLCVQKLPIRVTTVSVAKEIYQSSVLKLAGRACAASAWLVIVKFCPVFLPVFFPCITLHPAMGALLCFHISIIG